MNLRILTVPLLATSVSSISACIVEPADDDVNEHPMTENLGVEATEFVQGSSKVAEPFDPQGVGNIGYTIPCQYNNDCNYSCMCSAGVCVPGLGLEPPGNVCAQPPPPLGRARVVTIVEMDAGARRVASAWRTFYRARRLQCCPILSVTCHQATTTKSTILGSTGSRIRQPLKYTPFIAHRTMIGLQSTLGRRGTTASRPTTLVGRPIPKSRSSSSTIWLRGRSLVSTTTTASSHGGGGQTTKLRWWNSMPPPTHSTW